MDTSLLDLAGVSCSIASGTLFNDLNLTVNEGDIIVVQGRSGCGKTTLLKCIARLIPHEGEIRYRGRLAQQIGIPSYRTKVLYVPQRPSLLPGGPLAFLKSILALHSQMAARSPNERGDSIHTVVHSRACDITEGWNIDSDLWGRDWGSLSGGEAQRMLLAIAVALNTAEVLLLDEPTSALDEETSLLVEKCLISQVNSEGSSLRALLWITHSAEQSRRIGTRFVYLSGGKCLDGSRHSASPSLSSLV